VKIKRHFGLPATLLVNFKIYKLQHDTFAFSSFPNVANLHNRIIQDSPASEMSEREGGDYCRFRFVFFFFFFLSDE